jgi:hypothetical protein
VMNHFSTKLVIMKNTTYILRRIKNKTLVWPVIFFCFISILERSKSQIKLIYKK